MADRSASSAGASGGLKRGREPSAGLAQQSGAQRRASAPPKYVELVLDEEVTIVEEAPTLPSPAELLVEQFKDVKARAGFARSAAAHAALLCPHLPPRALVHRASADPRELGRSVLRLTHLCRRRCASCSPAP